MELLRTLIVDDERNARMRVRKMLALHAQIITIVGEAEDGEEALEKVKKLSPDLVILDIQMPKLDAFEVLQRLEKPLPRIIFTTAYDKYAVKAFELNSIDYLLKPISPKRFAQAIARLTPPHAQSPLDLSSVYKAMKEMEKIRVKRIQVKIGDTITFVDLSDISYFQGEDYLTAIFYRDKKYLIEMPLYELETKLPPAEFVRIHRSTIINVTSMKELRRSADGKLRAIMKQPPNTELVVSRSYAGRIGELFQCL